MKGLRFWLIMVFAVVLLVSASDRFAAADLLVTSDQLVNISGSPNPSGILTSFKRILANGTTSVFTIPAGKVFVVTRLQGVAYNVPGLVHWMKFVLESKATGKEYFKQGMDSISYDVIGNHSGGVMKGENFYPGFPISKPSFVVRLLDGDDKQLAGKFDIRILGYLTDIPAP